MHYRTFNPGPYDQLPNPSRQLTYPVIYPGPGLNCFSRAFGSFGTYGMYYTSYVYTYPGICNLVHENVQQPGARECTAEFTAVACFLRSPLSLPIPSRRSVTAVVLTLSDLLEKPCTGIFPPLPPVHQKVDRCSVHSTLTPNARRLEVSNCEAQ